MIGAVEKKKYGNIDGLRTFGCLAIVLWHVKANLDVTIDNAFFNQVIHSWDYLVYLFMMISGFGMCNGYYEMIRDGKFDANRFYLKRYKKILPFFVLLILANLIVEFNSSNLYEGFMEFTLLFGFLPNNNLHVIGVAWTLGVIFVFYITFPYFVFLLYSKKRAWFSLVASMLITFCCQSYFMREPFVNVSFVCRHSFLYCIPFFIMGGLFYLYRMEL